MTLNTKARLLALCAFTFLFGAWVHPAGMVDVCQEAGSGEPAVPLRRLSKLEFSRTVSDLIGNDVAGALPALSGLTAGIPDDDMQAGFANINWSLSADHVSGYFGVANEIGVQVSNQAPLRKKILPCALDSLNVSDKCVDSLLSTFVVRAYRRPLEAGERADLKRFFQERKAQAPARALSDLITRVLMSPSFLFKEGVAPVRAANECPQRRADESFRRASILAYGLWGSMPDATLFAKAGTLELLRDDVVTTEVERMLRDERAREWLRTFFRQWLHYDHFNTEGYSWGFVANIGREHLHDNAAEELDRFIEHIVWTQKGSFYDLMTSRKVFTSALGIRRIYGLPDAPTGGFEEAPADRAGVLTRVAMLAQGFDDASLVKRGATIRRQVLCDPLSPPDPSTLPEGSLVPPAKDIHQTTRQRWEARTAPAICQGCHRLINPLGFSLEAYDGIGRFRKIEKQAVPDSSPQAYTEFEIDTKVIPNVAGRNEPPVGSPAELSEFIGKSPKANFCFVKQLSKFVSGRIADDSDLGDLEALANNMMRPGGSVHDALVGVVKQQITKH